jgi:hypothetical protein
VSVKLLHMALLSWFTQSLPTIFPRLLASVTHGYMDFIAVARTSRSETRIAFCFLHVSGGAKNSDADLSNENDFGSIAWSGICNAARNQK